MSEKYDVVDATHVLSETTLRAARPHNFFGCPVCMKWYESIVNGTGLLKFEPDHISFVFHKTKRHKVEEDLLAVEHFAN